mgnify:CR=1 FL=1
MAAVKSSFLIAISFTLAGISQLALASESELVKALLNFDQIEVDFVQNVRDRYGNSLELSSGKGRVVKPSIEWRTIDPYEQTIVLVENELRIYDPDLEQLIIKDITDEVSNVPLHMLRSLRIEIADFMVVKEEVDLSGDEYFSLSPQSEQVLFSRIEIKTLKEQLQTIRVVGISGEVTEIKLSNFKNLDLEDPLFEISVPEGTDIVEG